MASTSIGGDGQGEFLFPNETNQMLQEGSQINISWTGTTKILALDIVSDARPSYQRSIGGVDIMNSRDSYFLWVLSTTGASPLYDSSTQFYFKLTGGNALQTFRSVSFCVTGAAFDAATSSTGSTAGANETTTTPGNGASTRPTSTPSPNVSATAVSASPNGLSTGAKAGIGVGVGLAIILLAGLVGVFLLMLRRRKHAHTPQKIGTRRRPTISEPKPLPPIPRQTPTEPEPPIPVHTLWQFSTDRNTVINERNYDKATRLQELADTETRAVELSADGIPESQYAKR